MRLLAPIALLGSFLVAASLDAQILTEHAAAAAGATIGSAAGKSISNAVGGIFGQLDKQTSNAAATQSVKKTEPKATVVKPKTATDTAATPQHSSSAARAIEDLKRSSEPAARPAHAAAHRHFSPAAIAAKPVVVAAPVTIEVAPREISPADVAAVQVGASGSQLQAALGAPESRVVIPDDDGHLVEICQYWSKGQAVGTVRLVNGQVASVEAAR